VLLSIGSFLYYNNNNKQQTGIQRGRGVDSHKYTVIRESPKNRGAKIDN